MPPKIAVKFKIRPRHAKGIVGGSQCWEYSGTQLFFEAQLQFKVDSLEAREQALLKANSLWLHQDLTFDTVFRVPRDPGVPAHRTKRCIRIVTPRREIFHLRGVTGGPAGSAETTLDDHVDGWNYFGVYCPEPGLFCEMRTRVRSSLSLVTARTSLATIRTKSGQALTPSIVGAEVGSSTQPYQRSLVLWSEPTVEVWNEQSQAYGMTHDLPSANALLKSDVEAAQRMGVVVDHDIGKGGLRDRYGAVWYRYAVLINHCPDTIAARSAPFRFKYKVDQQGNDVIAHGLENRAMIHSNSPNDIPAENPKHPSEWGDGNGSLGPIPTAYAGSDGTSAGHGGLASVGLLTEFWGPQLRGNSGDVSVLANAAMARREALKVPTQHPPELGRLFASRLDAD